MVHLPGGFPVGEVFFVWNNKFYKFVSKIVFFMKKLWKKLQQRFDRDFYRGDGLQFVWLAVFIVMIVLFWLAVSAGTGIGNWRVIELIMDPGAFVGSKEKGHVWLQLLVSLSGLVVFTGFMISTIGNFLARRTTAYAQGRVLYDFHDHFLLLGSGSQVVNIIRSLSDDASNADRDIVVQTCRKADDVREFLDSQLPANASARIHVVYGSRNLRSALADLNLSDAYEVYIVGEDNEEMHDALNLETWRHVKDLCRGKLTGRIMDCYLLLDRVSSERIFHFRSGSASEGNLYLNVINLVDNAAQRMLVSRIYIPGRDYPALDRSGIGPDDDTNVHLVISGMTQMAYAVAMTAAHICHFPNFRTKRKRTKITFIMPEIRREMDYFMGHFASIMELSYVEFKKVDSSGKHLVLTESDCPDRSFLGDEYDDPKGFLDVEWEFIDGGVESQAVREYIEECVKKDKDSEYLTVALCGHEPEANVAEALYLPMSVFEKKIPVFVYQKWSGEVLRAAEDNDRYSNLYPFGMVCDCMDPQFKEHLKIARRVNHVYRYPDEEIPHDDILRTEWAGIGYALQQSNLRVADSIPAKMRSIACGCDYDQLAEVEHNRWNLERLIIGFRAFSFEERSNFHRALSEDDKREDALKKHDYDKKYNYMHMDIAPYSELPESSKEFDASIVRNIRRILN